MASYNAANRKALNAAEQRRKKANRDRVNERQRARRVLTGYAPLKNQFWNALKAQYDYRCLACGRQEPEIRLEKDHVVPVLAGGTNDPVNFQPLCHPCNASKGRRAIDYRPPEMAAVHGVTIRET
jgi:5-methylcytosine-specific restriction endonuclease McrA